MKPGIDPNFNFLHRKLRISNLVFIGWHQLDFIMRDLLRCCWVVHFAYINPSEKFNPQMIYLFLSHFYFSYTNIWEKKRWSWHFSVFLRFCSQRLSCLMPLMTQLWVLLSMTLVLKRLLNLAPKLTTLIAWPLVIVAQLFWKISCWEKRLCTLVRLNYGWNRNDLY